VIGYTEFDGFNNVSDPLYREGSKALLQKALDDDDKSAGTAEKRADAPSGSLRDAPADISDKQQRSPRAGGDGAEKFTVQPLRKNRLIKMVPVDPVNVKSVL
jgi:hypothetical protein